MGHLGFRGIAFPLSSEGMLAFERDHIFCGNLSVFCFLSYA